MSGTTEGGLKAAKTIQELYGEDFYKNIGKKGNLAYSSIPKEKRKPRGFALDPKRASRIGSMGGRKRKGWRKNPVTDNL